MLRVHLLALNRVVLAAVVGGQFIEAAANSSAVCTRDTLSALRLVECTLTAASGLLIVSHGRLELSLLMTLRMICIA